MDGMCVRALTCVWWQGGRELFEEGTGEGKQTIAPPAQQLHLLLLWCAGENKGSNSDMVGLGWGGCMLERTDGCGNGPGGTGTYFI
jgi:hypothetical protein